MTKCRVCESGEIKEFMDYGKQPLGNVVVDSANPKDEYFHDLKLGVCTNCWMVQQTDLPDYKEMLRMYDTFVYVPYGALTRNNLTDLALSIWSDFKPKFVMDIGSNDGTLLEPLLGKCDVLGIEPAKEISEIAQKKGIRTINGYFTESMADVMIKDYGKPNVITMTQVLQHIPHLDGFLNGIKKVLADDGVLIVDVRDFAETLKQNSYDTVYAETVWLFTLTSISNMLKTYGLNVFRAEVKEAYGGTLRIYASRKSTQAPSLMEKEREEGVTNFESYQKFAANSYELRDKLKELVMDLHNSGKTIMAYGASATSTTLLNFCGIDYKLITAVVDENPMKQNHFTSGTHIPIMSMQSMAQHDPDYMLLTAWRLYSDISAKIPSNVKVIMPLPEVTVR